MEQAKKKRINRIVGRVLLVAYIALLIFFVFFSDELGRKVGTGVRRMNTHPFHEIKRFWAMRYTYGWKVTLTNLGGNILIFAPLGFLIPMSAKNKILNNFFVVTFISMCVSGAIELVQIVTKVGAFDIDDIILNTLGAVCGYIVYAIAKAIN